MSKVAELRNDLGEDGTPPSEGTPTPAPESSPQAPEQTVASETGQPETAPQVGEDGKPAEAKAQGEDWEKRYKDIQSHNTKIEQQNKELRERMERLETQGQLDERREDPPKGTSPEDSIAKFAKKHKLTPEEAEAFTSMVNDLVGEKLTPLQERMEAQSQSEQWNSFVAVKKDWKTYEPEMAEILRKNPWMKKLPNAPFHLYALAKDQNGEKEVERIREEVRKELQQKREADANAPGISGERTAPAGQGSKVKDAEMEAFTSPSRRGNLRQQLS